MATTVVRVNHHTLTLGVVYNELLQSGESNIHTVQASEAFMLVQGQNEQTQFTRRRYRPKMAQANINLLAARMSDLDNFHELFSNDDVMRYWSTAPHKHLSQTEEYLRNMVQGKWNGTRDFVIEYSHSSSAPKSVIGKLGLWDGHEIGFMLNRGFWGQGLMKEAMSTFLQQVWGDEGAQEDLQDIVADTDPRNSACIGLLKSFGFEEIGYREKTGETHLGWCDSVDLMLTRPVTRKESHQCKPR
ncbi:MAG: hypothetical protein Q9207_003271 [Kuettlingeria erythrocarpa]